MKEKIINSEVNHWLKARDITPAIWKLIKSKFPNKYSQMKADLTTADIDNVKYGFNEGLKPICISISY